MPVPDNLRKAREKCELSYAELANLTGIAKSTLQRYETGTTSKIPLDVIEKIAIALKTSPQALLGWQTEESNLNKPDSLSAKDEKDVSKMIEDLRARLSVPGVTYKGKPMTSDEIERVINGMQITLEIAMQRSKDKK